MKDEQLLKEIYKTQKEILRELRVAKNTPAKETWVKASRIVELTGWDWKGLQYARNNNLVKYRQLAPKVYEYLLESIADDFKKRRAS
jgi:hypothetical protein